MSEQDEATRVVIVRDGGGAGLGSFFVGALLGAGLALLFAPKSGEETQEELKERARNLKASAEARVRDAQKQLEDRLDHAREGVTARVEGVKGAVEAGRKAALDARDELERKLERSKAAYRAGIDAARDAVAAGPDQDAEDDA